MNTLSLIFGLVLSCTTIFAQQTVTWIGGTPGQETNWNEARNWSNYKVPDAFSNVLIPDVSSSTFSAPVISNSVIELNSILIESNAQLSLAPDAILIIHQKAYGIINPKIQLGGTIIMPNPSDKTTNAPLVLVVPKQN